MEQHPDGYTINGEKVTYNGTTVSWTNKNMWQHIATVTMSGTGVTSGNINVFNDYTADTPLTGMTYDRSFKVILLLVLCIATAYTDPESEAQVEKAISRLIRGRTVIALPEKRGEKRYE